MALPGRPGLDPAAADGGGERWWQPHREHLYQRLVLSGRSPHARVTAGLAAASALFTAVALLGWAKEGAGLLWLALLLALAGFGVELVLVARWERPGLGRAG